MGIPHKTYIKCSQIHNSIQADNSEISKVKLNSSQEGRGGETPYDSTIVTKLAVHPLIPAGELLPPRHGDRRDDEDGHR